VRASHPGKPLNHHYMALFVSADNVVIRVRGAVGMGVTLRVCLSEEEVKKFIQYKEAKGRFCPYFSGKLNFSRRT
jgi:hypothetical protein